MLFTMIRYTMQNILKILLVCVMIMSAIPLAAQTSGDKLYSQGLELQKKQTVQSQKAAIAKFQSAKKLYDSAAKKKQCDDAIAVSNNIIKSISTPRSHRGDFQSSSNTEVKTSVLELSNEMLQLDCEQRSVTINITTTEDEWTVAPIANNDGMTFVSVTQHPEERNFEVVCPPNNSTRQRRQTIEVRAGGLKRSLIVEQSGKPTILSVEKTVVEFSSKGGSKAIEVYSNSDSIEDENNNRNWKVVSKPDWVNVVGEEAKEKGVLGKLVNKAKEVVTKNSASAEDPSVVVSIMKLVVASKPKGDNSRSGEIVISSENQQATIIVQQN